MPHTLLLILLLLAASVVVVAVCRAARQPPILGYLLVGIALGPHALGVVADDTATRELAEFGIVFLMFSIGLEFSLPQLRAMRRAVFGLGFAQVAITTVAGMIVVQALGYDWRAAIVPGTSLWQIFVHDPSGVMMELTFDGKAENRPTPEIPADRVYMAGQPFGNVKQKAA